MGARIRGSPTFPYNDSNTMIRLTRLNKQPFVLNAELMQMIEEAPDTIITLVNNEKFLVLESAEEVIQRIIDYHRSIRLFKMD